MDKIVDHLFVFRGEGIIEDFPGNYSDYRVYESSKVSEERENKTTTSEKTENNWRDTSGGKLSYSEQKEYKQLEKDIQKLEEKKEALQHKFTDPDLDGDAIAKLSIELKEVTDAIEEKTERWFELSSILEG
jgi:ATP-binding cassette subfamily F protein uup